MSHKNPEGILEIIKDLINVIEKLSDIENFYKEELEKLSDMEQFYKDELDHKREVISCLREKVLNSKDFSYSVCDCCKENVVKDPICHDCYTKEWPKTVDRQIKKQNQKTPEQIAESITILVHNDLPSIKARTKQLIIEAIEAERKQIDPSEIEYTRDRNKERICSNCEVITHDLYCARCLKSAVSKDNDYKKRNERDLYKAIKLLKMAEDILADDSTGASDYVEAHMEITDFLESINRVTT